MSHLFSWLGSLLGGAIVALQDYVGTFLYALWEWTKREISLWWALVVIVATLAWQGLTLIGDLTMQAFTALATFADGGWHAGIASANAPGTLSSILALTNTFYPLEETLRYMAALIVFVWLPLAIYRFVKSWIPTVAT